MKLKLIYKSVFGRDSYYPDDDISRVICKLGNFKTFAPWQIEVMKKEAWQLDIKADIPLSKG